MKDKLAVSNTIVIIYIYIYIYLLYRRVTQRVTIENQQNGMSTYINKPCRAHRALLDLWRMHV